jgi:hypothetical protein
MSTRGRNLSIRKSTQTNQTSIETQVRGSLYDVQSQARRTNQIKGGFGNRRPSGMREGDVLARFGDEGAIQLGVSDARGGLRLINIPPTFATLPPGIEDYLDLQTGAVPPVLANFPEDGDWGQYYDTVSTALYWVRNIAGSLTFLNFLGFVGEISDTQHGDRSATTTTMHKFPQISGTITDVQHGSRGGGNLHNAVTGASNGFMSAADKNKLDAATASATVDTLVLRDGSGGAAFVNITTSGTVDSIGAIETNANYTIGGTQVMGARITGWGAPTGTISRAALTLTAGVAYSQADFETLIQSVKALITDARTQGWIGT